MSMLACVNTPPRRRSVRATCRNSSPVTPCDPIMPRQCLIDERVVANRAARECCGCSGGCTRSNARSPRASRPADVSSKPRKRSLSRGHSRQLAELQPLAGEVLHELAGPGVVEHPGDLAAEIRPQRSRARLAEQLVVGHAAPEKVREPAGQLELGQRAILVRLLRLDQEQELRRGEHRRQGELDRTLVSSRRGRGPAGRSRRRRSISSGGTGRRNARSANRAITRRAQSMPRLIAVIGRAEEDPPMRLGKRFRH